MNKTIKLSFAKRIGFSFMMMLLTATTAWATTTSTINVGGTDYTLFTGFTATDGTAVDGTFVYGNMVDGNTSTSFHAVSGASYTFTSPAFVEFNTDDPIIPKGFIFNTYDANSYKPSGWVLKAKANATDDWTELSSYSGQTLSSGQEFQYACNNDGNTKYKYFRFEASNTNNNIWLTEIRLYGFENLTYTHLTVRAATCTEVGIKQECWKRSDGKYFTDENGTNELAEDDVIDPIKPHTGVHHAADANHIEYWQCSMCNKYFSDAGCTTEITEAQTLVVKYLDANGTLTTLNENATAVTSTTTSWSNGWFVVYDNVTIADRISVSGTVNLILCNGATLTASKGITVGSSATFNVYAQSNDEATMGALVADATSESNCAGIGGVNNTNFGTIVINGGKITATGNNAGIGGGYGSNSGSITINGGIVSATAGDYSYSAGIGGGNNGYVASVTLNGGIITATGDTHYGGAGIGTGSYGGNGTMTITIGSGVKKLVATKGKNSDCIGKQPNASTTVNVVFKDGNTTVTGDAKDAVFYDSGEGSVRQVRAKALNHAVTMSNDLKANITATPEYALTGETVTLTLGTAVDASTLKVNDGTSDLTLTDAGNSKYTFTMPNGNVTVTATAAQSYAVTLPANMGIVSATNAADANGKYITGTTVTFKASFPYAASDVSDGTSTLEPDANGIYTVTVADADITITATIERSATIDLSDATGDFNAIEGDVLTGTTSHTVTIASGAGISLSGATISGGIVCEGTATITLVGTNSTTGAQYKAGIQIGGSGTTLTIRGDGSLTATGGTDAAGIGLNRAWNVTEDVVGGNIVINGGNITANGGGGGAGIGAGVTKDTNNSSSRKAIVGNITITGGTVTAVGGSNADGIGAGENNYNATIQIGTVTIYDTIDMVDASKITETVTYMHVDGESATDVTANKTDYFTIGENGDRRIIVPKDDTDYTITIADGIEHGTLTVAAATAKYMQTVTVTATPAFGYRFVRLIVKDAQNNDVASTNNTFQMPKGGATVSAVFEQGVHGTTEFVWGYPGPDGFVKKANIYDGVTTVNLQQSGQSYQIWKYNEYTNSKFRLDNDTYEANIPYAGGTGEFYEIGNATNFSLNYDGQTGYYDITLTDVGNGKWGVSILPTAAQMDVVPDQTYTGSAITPEPLVIAGSLSLTKDEDYTYSYENNTNVGTATVRATFQGDYASLGYVEKTFTIKPSTIMVNVTGSGTVTIGDKSASNGEAFGVMSEKGASVVLTLAPESGNTVRSVEYGYTNSKGTNRSGAKLPISDGTATLTVPDNLKDGTGVTVTVTFAPALNGGADEASAVALTDATVTDLGGGWYKVENDITFDHTLNLLADTYLTIGEGKTMTVNTATDRGIDSDYTLTVSGAGALSVTASGSDPIAVRVGSYVQTGATVTASGFIGIRCCDDFDADVTNDLTFSGGQLTVTGTSDGIWADNTITISCTNASDFIQSSSYEVLSGGTIKVADGKALTDGTNIYSGTLTSEQISAIATKTLTKSSWTELKMALEAGQSVTLTNNVARVNSERIEPTGTVTLDLNGYTIDGGTSQTNPLFSVNNGVSMTITDSQTGGNLCNSGTNPTVSVNGGTLTLAAGTINAQSNGVYVFDGSFTMTGGTITGGTVSGVGLSSNGSFTMTGGTITGNAVGVDVNSATATFTVSGNVSITGNTTKDVSLKNNDNFINPIRISGALNEAARIGINISDAAANAITGNVVMVFTDGLKGYGSKQNFTLNGRDGLALATTESGEIALGAIYTLTLPSAATVSGYTAEQDAPVGSVAYKVPCGDVVTINYTGAVTEGKSVRFTIPNGTITYLGSTDGQGKCITFTMPGSNATISKDADEQDYTFANITLKEEFEDGNSCGLQATLDGSSLATISIPKPISVGEVRLNRTFTPGKPATLMLPFNTTYWGKEHHGASFHTFTGVTFNETTQKWEATMTELDKGDGAYNGGALVANTPYIVVPTASSITLTNGGTLCTAEGGGQETKPSGSNWTFKGTYSYMKWTTDTSDPDYNAKRADEIGKAYGFAGKEKTDIEVGDFVRVASGAKIRPMGCYLLWSDTQNAARRMTRGAADSELPQRITVRLVSSNGETTAIGELDTKTGEISMDGWWTLDGIKLSGKPSQRGIYINNGRKIVIK